MRSLSSMLRWFRPDHRPKRRASRLHRNGLAVHPGVEKLEERLLLTPQLIFGDAGRSGNRIDLVILGDGYTQDQIGDGSLFDAHVNNFLNYLFDENRDFGEDLFPRYKEFFNVWRIDVESAASGADIPSAPDVPLTAMIDDAQTTIEVNSVVGLPQSFPFTVRVETEEMTVTAIDGNRLTVTRGANGTTAAAHAANTLVDTLDAPAVFVDTALSASYRANGGAEDNLNINQSLANQIVQMEFLGTGIDPEMRLVSVNSTKFGGGGGDQQFAVFAGGSPASREYGLRELARQFSDLGLENDDGDSQAVTTYAGLEPANPNLTISQFGTFLNPHKWDNWMGYLQPGIGVISTYAGGGGFDDGIFRPSMDSRLRSFGNPFDAVAREAMILDIYNFVDPLDSHTDNGRVLTQADTELRVFAVGDSRIGASTNLSVDMLETDGFLFVDDASGFPAGGGFDIRIDNEEMRVLDVLFNFTIFDGTGLRNVDAFIVQRGINGTLPTQHFQGAEVSNAVFLQGDIDAAQTAIGVTSASLLTRALPFDIVIDNEQMRVTGIDVATNTITVIRGVNGTTATDHFSGTQLQAPDQFNDVFRVDWQVNGITQVFNSRTFRPSDFGFDRDFNNGNFTVKAIVVDQAATTVDWVRTNESKLRQEVVWNFNVPAVQPAILEGPQGVTIDVVPTFRWNPVDADGHTWEIRVIDLATGDGVIQETGITSTAFKPTRTNFTPTLLDGHTYRWLVRGIDTQGVPGAWSASADFTVRAGRPEFLNPTTNLATSPTPTIQWSPVDGAIRYDLWINDVTTGQSGVIRETNLTGTSFTPPPLVPSHTYIAAVRAIFPGDVPGHWSGHRDFTVQGTLEAPQIQGPMGILSSTAPTFQWSPVPGADRYDIWVNDLTTGQSGVIRNTNVTGTSFTPTTPLESGHNYVWTVRAMSGVEIGTFATHAYFSILAQLPAPQLTAPNPLVFTRTPTFEWKEVPGAARYDLWVNNETTGQSQIIRRTSLATTSFTAVAPLPNGHTYVWTVRAIDSDGVAGVWAPAVRFEVGGIIARPELVAPIGSAGANGAPHSTTPTFQWSTVEGAVRYDIWVNDLTTGQSQVIRNTNVTATTYTPSAPLTAGHRYIWTVRAFTATGDISNWAEHRTFTVTSVDSQNEPSADGLIAPLEAEPAPIQAVESDVMLAQAAGPVEFPIEETRRSDEQQGDGLPFVQEPRETERMPVPQLVVQNEQQESETPVDVVMADWTATEWWADDDSALDEPVVPVETGTRRGESSARGIAVAAVAPFLVGRVLRRKRTRKPTGR